MFSVSRGLSVFKKSNTIPISQVKLYLGFGGRCLKQPFTPIQIMSPCPVFFLDMYETVDLRIFTVPCEAPSSNFCFMHFSRVSLFGLKKFSLLVWQYVHQYFKADFKAFLVLTAYKSRHQNQMFWLWMAQRPARR